LFAWGVILAALTFELERLRLHMRATEDMYFPPFLAGNLMRGVFGSILRVLELTDYVRIFRPASKDGPSGLRDAPRPFVLRAAHLDGRRIRTGERFHFDAHLFDESVRDRFTAVFEDFGRARLEGSEVERIAIDLSGRVPASRVRVEFLTPTELKSDGEVVDWLEFRVLFARVRDRVATLRKFYGAGPLDIDFRGLGERAALVKLVDQRIERIDVERRSSRTGQTHSLGGFVGEVGYEGDLGEFVPYLRAGEWTGVGRQTVWGKGAIRIIMNDVSQGVFAA
jgi:hypothetical protein